MQTLLLISAALLLAGAADPRFVCYYWSPAYMFTGLGRFLPSDLDPNLCTHYIYSAVNINSRGGLFFNDESFDLGQGGVSNFTALRNQNPELKLMVYVGGWGAGSVNFSLVAANETLRTRFASNAVAFIEEYGFDGADVGWEYPGRRDNSTPADKENFILFLRELKEAFEPGGYILSASVASTQSTIDTSYDVPALNDILDFFNVMSYDLHGTWSGETGANAPLYPQPSDAPDTALTVNASVNTWLANGASASKINVGLGLYGHAYILANASSNGTGAAVIDDADTMPTWHYIEICSDIVNNPADWKIINYNNSFVYAVKDTLWIGYDNEATLYAKGAFAKSLDLGGLMFWTTIGDDFRGYCGEKYALTKAAIAGYNA